ncbi:obg-like ATPase 1 isoform X1 [Cottoperca gobio]|uniref:Obg-like ATPase 1 isoform X1 n=1 Tax=Cottoperca gobio TaxID=56716 RepID=A0A6J2RZQ6_COTGO|nr:obg-like ATPase 1 isoform X1 [Cottoperca gobio]
MAPKKGKGEDATKPLPLIGRFGTSLKIGVVGLPNVGKSTFFNVLTKSQAAAEHFPFCTTDPNESRVPIPDERYDFLCQFHKPPRYGVSSFTYYSHFRSVVADGLLAIGAFEDKDIIHVEGTVDPVRDMEIIHEELRLKDEEMIGPIIDKLEKTAIRGGDKKLKPEYDVMCKIKSWVMDEKKHVRYYHDWNDKEKGTKAPQAAGKIHTDFEKGFIMAEVMKFRDFKEEGSENTVKAAGKYRQQ